MKKTKTKTKYMRELVRKAILAGHTSTTEGVFFIKTQCDQDCTEAVFETYLKSIAEEAVKTAENVQTDLKKIKVDLENLLAYVVTVLGKMPQTGT